MSTVLDDIMKRSRGQAEARAGVSPQPQIVQPQVQEPANRPVGDQASARAGVAPQPQIVQPTAQTAPAVEPVTTYTDIAKRISPEIDAAEKAKREKQLRTQKKVAAIGDAISALANMHYTGKSGINAYDPSATLSGKAKANYDKFLADVKSYEDAHRAAMLRGAELDAAATEALRKEAKADRRYEDAKATAAETARQQQENWEKNFDAARDKEARDEAYRDKAFEWQKQAKQTELDLRKEYQDALATAKTAEAEKQIIKQAYGKPKQHGVDGPLIYDRVWQHSWPEVFKVMKAAGVGKGEMGDFLYDMQFDKMTPQEKQNWVDEHFKEVPEAVAMMEELAKDTPESFRATQTNSEDWSGWSDDNSIDEDFQ